MSSKSILLVVLTICVKNIYPLLAINIFAQKEIDSLTYDNTQDINYFSNIKNNTNVKKYITVNDNVVQVGDTLILGNPNLKRALINNFDVRYELYPTAGEIFSATAFYKNFKILNLLNGFLKFLVQFLLFLIHFPCLQKL